jgi:hypothetical protein
VDFNFIEDGQIMELVGDSLAGKIKGELPVRDGVDGNALEFNKGNSIDLGDIATFERTEPFSLSIWVNPSDTTTGS